jgi:hypothetical protein
VMSETFAHKIAQRLAPYYAAPIVADFEAALHVSSPTRHDVFALCYTTPTRHDVFDRALAEAVDGQAKHDLSSVFVEWVLADVFARTVEERAACEIDWDKAGANIGNVAAGWYQMQFSREEFFKSFGGTRSNNDQVRL